ncbi:hypothetical protein FSP39_024477 [Pinctada imbricata]|uniref:Uncharacterized protein n=1 Tax=Pinctada imbricata TaxID=66713 RepID=A0AA89BP99_PINIB|nr:hypothetical protein FSP39_024477 [Pinctada imbricata]
MIKSSVFIIDEVTSFIRRWFTSLKNRFIAGGELQSDVHEASTNRETRELHVPTGFEAYELYFLRTVVVQDLQTFFSFAKELQKNNTEARSRLDDIWKHEEQRVKSMTEEQLKQYSQALRTALQTGISSTQTLRVNGKVYDMNHVASWCCPF